jgi:lysozyme family protein
MAESRPAIDRLLDHFEKGFAPKDNKNGAVNWGITQTFLHAIGVDADVEYIRNLSRDRAAALYLTHFWEPLSLSDLDDQHTAEVVLIAAVNMGAPTAIRILQRTLGVRIDGNVGPLTISATNRFGGAIIPLYKNALKAKYHELAASNPALYGDDMAGWLVRVEKS